MQGVEAKDKRTFEWFKQTNKKGPGPSHLVSGEKKIAKKLPIMGMFKQFHCPPPSFSY